MQYRTDRNVIHRLVSSAVRDFVDVSRRLAGFVRSFQLGALSGDAPAARA